MTEHPGDALQPQGQVPDRYELGPTTALAPQPVVLISSHGHLTSGEEWDNVAAVAWAGVVCTGPPQIAISLRPSRLTHELISETGEFAVNLVSRSLNEACDRCGVVSGRNLDKLAALRLDTFDIPESSVKGLKDSPLVLSCRVSRRIPLGTHELFIADVVNVYARLDLVDEKGALHMEQADLVAYAHGAYYSLGEVLGFFGYSVARESVRSKRLTALRSRQKASLRHLKEAPGAVVKPDSAGRQRNKSARVPDKTDSGLRRRKTGKQKQG